MWAEEGSAEGNAPQAGSGRNARISIRTRTGTHASLTSSRSRHVRIHRTIHTQAGIQNPNIAGKSAPHSSEFRHYTPYPDQHPKNASPEATWAQPLTREELS